MRIPSDIQVQVPAPRTGVLEALGLKIGETLAARVVAQNANGSTLLQLGNQQVSLNLPQQVPAGALLQFEVQNGGARLQLLLLGSTLPAPQAQAQAPLPQIVQLPPLPSAAQSAPPQQAQPAAAFQPANTPQSAAPAAQQASAPLAAQTLRPLPANANSNAYPRAPLTVPQPAPAAQSAVSANVQPSATGTNTSPGVAAQPAQAQPAQPQTQQIALPPQVRAALNLAEGQIVAVRVATPTPAGQPQITIGNQTVQAQLPGYPAPGTVFQAQAANGGAQLVVSQQASRPGGVPYPTLSHTSPAQGAGAPQAAAAQAPQVAPSVSAGSQPVSFAQIASESVARQDSVGKLLVSIAGLTRQATQDLPRSVNEVLQRIEGQAIRLDRQSPSAEQLKQAVAQSGVFLEAGLSRGLLPPAAAQSDMKGMLLLLKNMLGNFLGESASSHRPDQQPAPPVRGMHPRPDAQNPQAQTGDLNAREAARQLLSQTDSALSRMRLFQLSSLPDAGQRGNPAAMQEWHFELPFVLGQETRMAQFQVTRDGHKAGDVAERGWQLAFALHFSAIGSVGAKVSFRAKKTSAILWAENEDTAQVMEETLPELTERLTAIGLEIGSVRVRHQPPEDKPAAAGGFVDSIS